MSSKFIDACSAPSIVCCLSSCLLQGVPLDIYILYPLSLSWCAICLSPALPFFLFDDHVSLLVSHLSLSYVLCLMLLPVPWPLVSNDRVDVSPFLYKSDSLLSPPSLSGTEYASKWPSLSVHVCWSQPSLSLFHLVNSSVRACLCPSCLVPIAFPSHSVRSVPITYQ